MLQDNIYLYSWHVDPDLGIQSIHTDHFLPGDVVYFNNPDLDPESFLMVFIVGIVEVHQWFVTGSEMVANVISAKTVIN
ncbi:hypothetical protein [Peribacillus huizhouensis]|uniref:hypothetical protein n=1 Tax=Peribacillus huizhouensis TaxID=1501239 RepID=UPI0035E41648